MRVRGCRRVHIVEQSRKCQIVLGGAAEKIDGCRRIVLTQLDGGPDGGNEVMLHEVSSGLSALTWSASLPASAARPDRASANARAILPLRSSRLPASLLS
jgi:hypothetical protein